MSMNESGVELSYQQKRPGSSKPQSVVTWQGPGESENTVAKRLKALSAAVAARNAKNYTGSF
ncbi:MAG: hypothetical protein RLZZ283_156 [Candidatus Parcubacteria bacterium]|jgi:hypothetical protein